MKNGEQKGRWWAKQPTSKDKGSCRLFYVLPKGVCCRSWMVISQLILDLGPRMVQTDCTVNISMLSLGQFLHSFRRMKQGEPAFLPAFPCCSTLRLFRSILQWIISAALLTTLA